MLIRGEYVKNLTQSIKLCTTRGFLPTCVRVENELSPQFYPLNPRNKCTGQHNILKEQKLHKINNKDGRITALHGVARHSGVVS